MKVLAPSKVNAWPTETVIGQLNALWRYANTHHWRCDGQWEVGRWANRLLLEGELQRRGEQLPLF